MSCHVRTSSSKSLLTGSHWKDTSSGFDPEASRYCLVCPVMCTAPFSPVDSIRLAIVTSFDQISYCHFLIPWQVGVTKDSKIYFFYFDTFYINDISRLDKCCFTYNSGQYVATMYTNPHIYIYLVLIFYVLFTNIIRY